MSRAGPNEKELIKQWIVYLVGPQPDGPLSGYVVPEQTNSVFGSLASAASPARGSRNSMAPGAIVVPKTISTDVMRPLRLVGKDVSALVHDLAGREARERDLTFMARNGTMLLDDTVGGGGGGANVDVEDLDAFLAAGADESSSSPTRAAHIPLESARALAAKLCPPRQEAVPTDPRQLGHDYEFAGIQREVGKGEAEATRKAQQTYDAASRALTKAIEAFLTMHNSRLQHSFDYKNSSVSDAGSAALLQATTAEVLEHIIEERSQGIRNVGEEEASHYKAMSSQMATELLKASVAIAECEALAQHGALAVELQKLEAKVAAAASRSYRLAQRASTRIDALTQITANEDGDTPDAAEIIKAGEDPSSSTAEGDDSSRTPADAASVRDTAHNTLKTIAIPFAEEAFRATRARCNRLAERNDELPKGESIVRYQQARRNQLMQQTDDLRAMQGVTERQLQSLRGVYEHRDRPAAQQEHDKWQTYARDVKAVHDALAANYAACLRYDDQTKDMRSAQRAQLPPPPTRYVVRLPAEPFDPRPDAAKGGLHHLPLTWKEKYARMPPAALLTAQPPALLSPAQVAEAERKRQSDRLAGDDDDTPPLVDGHAGVAADMVEECARLQQALKAALNKKKAREQCHVALMRQMGALRAAAAAREEKEPALTPSPIKEGSSAALTDSSASFSPRRAAAHADRNSAAEARHALAEVLRKYS